MQSSQVQSLHGQCDWPSENWGIMWSTAVAFSL